MANQQRETQFLKILFGYHIAFQSIIVYHNITNSIQDYTIPSHASSTTLDLFAQEMKYLHNNGFRVLLLNQLGYDPNNNVFYIQEVG